MRTVTSIKPSKTGRKLRVELSDGGYFYADADGEAAKLLAEGDEIDDEALVRWRAHGGLTAEEAAALALGRRARSEKELRGKLADKGFTPDEADRALGRMRELGFLDDRALAEEIVAACAAENRSRRAALEALRRRGIEGELAREAAESIGDQRAAAAALVARRYGEGPLDRETRNKAGAFLRGRGFDWQDIAAVLRGEEAD